MKKIITISVIMLLLMMSVVSALTLSNPVPSDGSSVQGTASELFSIEGNETLISGDVYLDNGGFSNYPMVCAGTACSVVIDLSSFADLTTFDFFFLVDSVFHPPISTYLNFTVDRVPAQVTGLGITGVSETSLMLSWNPNPDADLQNYEVWRDGALLSSTASLTFLDAGLTTGQNYTYEVRAVDLASQFGLFSASVTDAPEDMTPPDSPVVSPVSAFVYSTFTPEVNLTYNEVVTLQVWSGSTLLTNLGTGTIFSWYPVFGSDGAYSFTFKAFDAVLNERADDYSMEIDTVSNTVNITIADIIHISAVPFAVKDTALANGVDYVIVGYDMSMYGGSDIRMAMSDLVSASNTIAVSEDVVPVMFCGADYDSLAQDIVSVPTYNTLVVDNVIDEGLPAVTCPDTNLGGLVEYQVMVKIPVPSGASTDLYSFDYQFDLY